MNISTNYTPSQYNNITDWCNAGKKLYIANHSFGLKTDAGDVRFIYESYLFKYHNLFASDNVNITFTDDEFIKYRYQPKLFCKDHYKTPELWSLLLFINNMTSVVQFNRKQIVAFSTLSINSLAEILNIHGEDIEDNRYSLSD